MKSIAVRSLSIEPCGEQGAGRLYFLYRGNIWCLWLNQYWEKLDPQSKANSARAQMAYGH
jgi:hypothetical protein